ncbi:MAG: Gfo/Idh/MocA family oxidoreductase [Spirochaetaceae bacterium]|jgi:predicted dehydrogenase|nr:Gfo/Idh/MocA family oxidoreductase [Spirochaetaceae bacterium]
MSSNNKIMNLAVLGAGSRGRAYSDFSLEHPERLNICAIAEPDVIRRNIFGKRFNIPVKFRYSSWTALLEDKPAADAVLIATPDREHVEPAVAFANAKYNILLEKPMAVDASGCGKISDAVNRNEILFGICHVLLYTKHTETVKEIIDSGRIGEIVSLQRLEPIGYWHFMHSYVRGNWRREDSSSAMLLAKSCHDIDWIMYIMGDTPTSVSSFGSLNHFRRENKPSGASDRCISCQVESTCPFSASRFYRKKFDEGNLVWPLDTVINELNREELERALSSGPYGRCVYDSDNTVMDNQVVNLNFSGKKSASFTVVAFSDVSHRKTRIFGTRGMVETDGITVRIYNFLTDKWEEKSIESGNATAAEGHGGGDFGLIDSYIKAWITGDYSYIKGNAAEAFKSHEVVFAAEKARMENSVIHV